MNGETITISLLEWKLIDCCKNVEITTDDLVNSGFANYQPMSFS